MSTLTQTTPLTSLRKALKGIIGDRDAKNIGRQEADALLAEGRLSDIGKSVEEDARDELEAFDPELVQTARFIIPVMPKVRELLSGSEWRPWSRLLAEIQILGEDERSSSTLAYLQKGCFPSIEDCCWSLEIRQSIIDGEMLNIKELWHFFEYFPVVSYLTALHSDTVVAHMFFCCHTRLLLRSVELEKLSAARIKLRRNRAVRILVYTSTSEQEKLLWAMNGLNDSSLTLEKREEVTMKRYDTVFVASKRYHHSISPRLPDPFACYLERCSYNLSVSKALGLYDEELSALVSWTRNEDNRTREAVFVFMDDELFSSPFYWAPEAMERHGEDVGLIIEAYTANTKNHFILKDVETLFRSFKDPNRRRVASAAFWRGKTDTYNSQNWIPRPDVISAESYVSLCLATDLVCIEWTEILKLFLSRSGRIRPGRPRRIPMTYDYFVEVLNVLLLKGADIESTNIWKGCAATEQMALHYLKQKKSLNNRDYRILETNGLAGGIWDDSIKDKQVSPHLSLLLAVSSASLLLPVLLCTFRQSLPPTPGRQFRDQRLRTETVRDTEPSRLLACYEIIGEKLLDWSVDREDTLRCIVRSGGANVDV